MLVYHDTAGGQPRTDLYTAVAQLEITKETGGGKQCQAKQNIGAGDASMPIK